MASTVTGLRRRGSVRVRVLTIVLLPAVSLFLVGIGFSGYLFLQGRQLRTFAQSTTRLADPDLAMMIALQQERLLSVEKLAGVTGLSGALAQSRDRTDKTLATVTGLAEQMADSGGAQVNQAMSGFAVLSERLPQLRAGVDSGQIPIATVYGAYNAILDNGVASMQAYANTAPDTTVAAQVLVSLQVYVVTDALSRSAALGAAIAGRAALSKELTTEYIRLVGSYHLQLDRLLPQLAPAQQQELKTITSGEAWDDLVAAEGRLLAVAADGLGPRAVAAELAHLPPGWVQAAAKIGAGLLELFSAQSTRTADLITRTGNQTYLRSLGGAVGVLLLTLMTIVIALRLSNRLIRRLGRLRADTLAARNQVLPDVVARLRAGEHVDPDTVVPRLDHGGDEIDELAGAFNSAQRAAVTATVAEARTRTGTQAAFLSIAHRSQVLMHRQLEVLDQAERLQEDPEHLKLLFEIDHLATRARRNAENLIILGGEQPGRQWRRPVALADVVRSAVAETEHYTRVTTTPVPDVWVDGVVVGGLIHLLAELVDNATSFSPPLSPVEIRTTTAGRGIVVEIEDRGLAPDEAAMRELNATLGDPPEFDVLTLSTRSRLGIFVVARLAARMGVRVTLAESPYGGVRAIVLIPAAVLAPSAAQDPDDGPAGPLREDPPTGLPGRADGPRGDEPADRGTGAVPLPSQNGAANRGPLGERPARATDGEGLSLGPAVGDDASGDFPPPLPQRRRQPAPGGLVAASTDPTSPGDPAPDWPHEEPSDPGPVSPEVARDRMSAFQRGSRLGRQTAPPAS